MQNIPQKVVLPEFQKYLLERRLVPEKYVPFYAHWANMYIVFIGRQCEGIKQTEEFIVESFIEALGKKEKIADWQMRQAQAAVRLYRAYFQYQTGGSPPSEGPSFNTDEDVIDAFRRAIRIKHYSYRTEETYIDWIKRFQSYIQEIGKTALADIGGEHVRDYLSHLALKRQVASSTQNQAFNALLFLMRNVLRKETGDLGTTVRAKRGPKLPVVLSIEEVGELFKHMHGPTLLIAQILYGAGLRLNELARMRVQDIDFDMKTITVRSGKGDKDRSTILPDAVKKALRGHLDKVKALHEKDCASGHGEVHLPYALSRKYPAAGKEWGWQYVFPSERLSVDPRSGVIRRHHISDKAIQTAIRSAVRKASITKRVSVHTLRHSFATHLLMNGVNIREIQDLLGHKSVETTMIYTHVLRGMSNAPMSPLDALISGGNAAQ